jgi:hypothetical protein
MGWVVSVTPRPHFTPGERTPGTHCIWGWVGPRAGLDAEVRGKILCLRRGSNPGSPIRSQTLYWLSYPGSPYCNVPFVIKLRIKCAQSQIFINQERSCSGKALTLLFRRYQVWISPGPQVQVGENSLCTCKKCSEPVPVLCWKWKVIQEVPHTSLRWRT